MVVKTIRLMILPLGSQHLHEHDCLILNLCCPQTKLKHYLYRDTKPPNGLRFTGGK
jgi:hypothetical protein